MHQIDWKKYALTLIITAFIFGTALLLSNYLNGQRFAQIRSIEERISTDILSLETQFDLLEELSCEDIKTNPVLTRELTELANRLNYTENQLGTDNAEVIRLKKSYSLLLIKDSILMNRISEKCATKPIFIHYFYSNQGDCPDCRRQGYVLTELQQEYPQLRVYAFDYNLDLSALDTLKAIYEIEKNLPALVINEKVYYGFKTQEEIEQIVPEIITLREATSTATSTGTTTGTSTR